MNNFFGRILNALEADTNLLNKLGTLKVEEFSAVSGSGKQLETSAKTGCCSCLNKPEEYNCPREEEVCIGVNPFLSAIVSSNNSHFFLFALLKDRKKKKKKKKRVREKGEKNL